MESQFYGGQSTLAKELSSGQSHTVENFQGSGKTLYIEVNSISFGTVPSVAQVDIFLGNCSPDVISEECGTCVIDSDCPIPIDSCSEAACVAGQCSEKPAPGCITFEFDLLTDDYPDETSWKLLDNCNDGNIVAGQNSYNAKEESFEVNLNLPWSRYTLIVEDAADDGMCCDFGAGHYEARWNEQRVVAGGEFDTSESTTFGSCGPAPTQAPVVPTPSPTNGPGAVFLLELLTDKYPEETTWSLVDECNGGEEAFLGGPYDSEDSMLVISEILPLSRYTFTINDSEDDGICCGYGDGSYTVTWNGSVVQNGGEFETSDSVTFGDCFVASNPTGPPTGSPTGSPTGNPTREPTGSPTGNPTVGPTESPTNNPTRGPTGSPTGNPTAEPTAAPNANALPTAFPANSPTSNPTASPTTGSPTSSPTVENNENALFELNILTDDYPEETTWTLSDDCNIFNGVVASGGPFGNDEKGVNFQFLESLPRSKYTLSINDSADDGICCGWGDGSYSVAWDGANVARGGVFTTTEKITFGECETDDDTTGLFAVSILTDNFPEETTWQVQDMCDGRNKVLTGGSYDAASTMYDIAEKLPPSRYKFIIKDKEEDGIYSDDYGYGSYSVYWEGDLVKEGGEFGKDERTVFGLGSCP